MASIEIKEWNFGIYVTTVSSNPVICGHCLDRVILSRPYKEVSEVGYDSGSLIMLDNRRPIQQSNYT